MTGSKRIPNVQATAERLTPPARRAVTFLRATWKRTSIFAIDALFIAYLFVAVSYVSSRIATGTGTYLAVPGGFVVLGTLLLAAAWGKFGTSVGLKAIQFLRGIRPLAAEAPRSARWYRTLWGWSVAAVAVVTLVAATLITQVNFTYLVERFPYAADVVCRLLHPDWSLSGEAIGLAVVTVFMALVATILGVLVAAPLSFLAARNLTRGPVGRPIYLLVRTAMTIVRSIEPIMWAIIFVVWVRIGPFAGVLALFVCSVADLTKLYSEQLECIDPGPGEAIIAVGGNRSQLVLYGIVPQIINPYLSFTLYRWDINVRMGTIIGMMGGGGLGQPLYANMRLNLWEEAGMYLLLIILIVWAMDTLSARLRERLS